MATTRIAYLLTTNEESERYIFSKNVLEKIGFTVKCFKAFPDTIPLRSHKRSTVAILQEIMMSEGYFYIFEDDINVLEEITLDEIIEYEKISNKIFYLGICEYESLGFKTEHNIRGHDVYVKQGYAYGTQAYAVNQIGAIEFLSYLNSPELVNYYITDVMLDAYCKFGSKTNIVRYDLESCIPGHKGVVFQDREKFPPGEN